MFRLTTSHYNMRTLWAYLQVHYSALIPGSSKVCVLIIAESSQKMC